MKPWNELTIRDNFIFSKVMRNKTICKTVVENLLGIKVHDIQFLEYERTLKEGIRSKGIRMDIYLEDTDKVINLEMQTTDNDILPKRARYYHAMTDMSALESGKKYKDLKDSYLVFICTFDPFGKGLPMYSFEYRCEEWPELKQDNGQHDIYFNALAFDKIREKSSYVAHFLEYIANGTVSSEMNIIDSAVQQTLQNEEWRNAYMLLELELQDAEDRGEKHEKKRIIQKMSSEGMSIEKIADIVELPVSEIQKELSLMKD